MIFSLGLFFSASAFTRDGGWVGEQLFTFLVQSLQTWTRRADFCFQPKHTDFIPQDSARPGLHNVSSFSFLEKPPDWSPKWWHQFILSPVLSGAHPSSCSQHRFLSFIVSILANLSGEVTPQYNFSSSLAWICMLSSFKIYLPGDWLFSFEKCKYKPFTHFLKCGYFITSEQSRFLTCFRYQSLI